jgi:hypothetical protein
LDALVAQEAMWVQWLAAGVREAALAGRVVSVVFWCVQNISNEREKWIDMQLLVAAFRR